MAIIQPASEHPHSGQQGSMHKETHGQHPKLATGIAAGGCRARLAANRASGWPGTRAGSERLP